MLGTPAVEGDVIHEAWRGSPADSSVGRPDLARSLPQGGLVRSAG